jgi:hypothetical protein
MPMYRAVPRTTYDPEHVHVRHPGSRLPANVPYFVDNLWEFARPADKPSRRHAVYASPTAALALDGAAGAGQPQDGFIACRLEFAAPPKMCQLSVADARYHPDVRRLQRMAQERLADLGPAGLDARLALAPLFLPGLARDELAGLMKGSAPLRECVAALAAAVTVWSDVPDTANGELFFELDAGNSYMLYRV